MRSFIAAIALLFICTVSFGQTIEGNRLLDLVGRPVTDPLFQNLKTQETFYTDAWDEDFTIYITRDNNIITEVELENGKLRYGSTTNRYGHYARTLPLQLSWNMSPADFSRKLGKPVLTSTSMNFSDYQNSGWAITIFYEQDKPVSISYKKLPGTLPVYPTIVNETAAPSSATSSSSATGWLLNLKSSDNAELNWSAFQKMVNGFNNLQQFAGKDSVDYIGEVYYSSNIKMPGFERVALKRKKKGNIWYLESFLKINIDSNKARNTFFALYDAVKATINANAKDEFILASVAKTPVSKSPMNWMAQWSLYSNYKMFTSGLGKLQFIIVLSGLKNAFKNDQMEYTIKVYLCDRSVNIDIFTWDTPK
jgi:hypothetical protein